MANGVRHCYSTSWTGAVLIALAATAGIFLVAEHRTHLWEFAPYLLLLACPLMHLFRHRGRRKESDD